MITGMTFISPKGWVERMPPLRFLAAAAVNPQMKI
jgi:hypothetical protein